MTNIFRKTREGTTAKRAIAFISIAVVAFTSLALASPQKDISVNVNGNYVAFPDAKPFIDARSRTLVPIRFIADELKADSVNWNPDTKKVTIVNKGDTITLTIGTNVVNIKSTGEISNTDLLIDTAPIVKNNRTFVPLRFISETMNAKVVWDKASYTVYISTDGKEIEIPELPPAEVPPTNLDKVKPLAPGEAPKAVFDESKYYNKELVDGTGVYDFGMFFIAAVDSNDGGYDYVRIKTDNYVKHPNGSSLSVTGMITTDGTYFKNNQFSNAQSGVFKYPAGTMYGKTVDKVVYSSDDVMTVVDIPNIKIDVKNKVETDPITGERI